jgi:hypothetical protein
VVTKAGQPDSNTTFAAPSGGNIEVADGFNARFPNCYAIGIHSTPFLALGDPEIPVLASGKARKLLTSRAFKSCATRWNIMVRIYADDEQQEL